MKTWGYIKEVWWYDLKWKIRYYHIIETIIGITFIILIFTALIKFVFFN